MPTAVIQRSDAEQQDIDSATAKLTLYHYATCVFCAQVKNVINALNLKIKLRDILENAEHRRNLIANGGRSTVPCLLVESDDGSTQWMYESRDIIIYLIERFSPDAGEARA